MIIKMGEEYFKTESETINLGETEGVLEVHLRRDVATFAKGFVLK